MKKHFTLLFALLCASVMGWADPTPYCGETSSNANFTFSLMNVSGNTYRIQFDAIGDDEFLSVYNINCGVNQSIGAGIFFGGDNAANWVITDKQAYLNFSTSEAGSAPTGFYGNYFCFNKKGGGLIEISSFSPSDVDWTATCSGGCSDSDAPTVTAVAKSDITYNSIVLTITASDNDGGTGIARYIVKNGDTQIASSTTSPITLTGLNAGTTYDNIKVIAKDGCNNESSAFDVESFTTLTRASECEGDLGHFATWNTKRVHYKIEYLPTIEKIRYEVRGYDTQVLDYLEINTTSGNSNSVPIVNGVAVWKQTAPAAGTVMGIQFVFSTDAIGGNEINAENLSSFTGNNEHLVYYKSRDCAADPEPAYAPTTTPDESTIFNDCQIYSILGSDYYSSVGFNGETNAWGGGTATTETIDGRDVLHIANSNYLERGFNAHDVSGFTHIHFDVWTQDPMNLGMKLMAYEDGWKEGDKQNFTTNAGSWTSVDLALTGFNHSYLHKIQGIYPSDMAQQNVYFTNIYFYKTTDDVSCYETLNLAENKPSEGGFVPGNLGEVPAKANDGNEDSRWVTWADRPASEEWWYVDLKNNYAINKIEVVWGADYSTNYILQTRTEAPSAADKADDAAWVTIATVTDAAANSTKTNTFTTATGRYVRLHSLSRSSNCIRLAELRVFASGYAVTDTNDPVITTAEVANDSPNQTSVKLHLVATDVEDGAVTTFLLNKGDDNWLPIVTDGSDTYTVSPLERGHYSYQVKARDHAGNVSAISTINFDILDPTENLALDQPVVAGYTPTDPAEIPTKANDGNLGTPWTTYNDQPMDVQWWSVDLGEVYQLSAIDLFWDVPSNHYLIQVAQTEPSDRTDDAQWFTALEVNETQHTGNTEGDKNHYALNVPARYVRFKAVTKAGSYLKLWEFRVFGTGYASLDTNNPVITTAEVASDSPNETSVKLHLVATDVENVTIHSFLLNKGDGNWQQIATDASDFYTVSDLERGHYSYQVKAIDPAVHVSAVSTINFTIFNPAENLALNKEVVAGYTPSNLGEVPTKANDGDLGTPWTTYNGQPMDVQWWSVDLGAVYQLTDVDLFWGVRSNHYLIQVAHSAPIDRADDTQWYTIQEVNETQKTGQSEEDKNRYAVDASARYIRFKALSLNDDTFLKLWELRAFGSAYASADNNAPVVTTASVSYGAGKAYLTLEATDTEDGTIKLFRVVNTTTGEKQLLTTDGENKIAIENLEIDTEYDFEIQAMDRAANLSAVRSMIVRLPATAGNIAKNKPVTAGFETGGAAESKEKANDGNPSTYWATWNTGDVTREWIYVDLQGLYDLRQIVVTFDVALVSNDYLLQYRREAPTEEEAASDEAWTEIAEVTTASGENLTVATDANCIARYIRFRTKKASVRLAELEVYADAAIIDFNDAGSNSPIIAANEDATVNVVLNRSISADNTWYTLCLPFDMDADKVIEVFGASTIATLTGSEDRGSIIHLNFDYVNTIQAGKPYLIKVGKNFISGSTIEGVQIKNVDPSAEGYKAEAEHMHFQGTFDKINLRGADKRYVSANNTLYSPNSTNGTNIGAFRCYFTIPEGSSAGAPGRQAVIVFGPQTATGCENIATPEMPSKFMLNGVLYILRDGKTYNAQGLLIE